MTLLRIDASVRTDGSVSRELGDIAQHTWQAEHPGTRVVRRDLGLEPLAADLWPTIARISPVIAGRVVPSEEQTPEQRTAVATAGELIDELTEAEAVIVATPLYNFGVPQHLKNWIDLVLTDPRLASAGPEVLGGRPLILAVARGGGYGPGTPREGWDHATPYLQRIFGDLWGMDVHLTVAELTLADVTPAMESLRDLAADSRHQAREIAREHGLTVAKRLKRAAA